MFNFGGGMLTGDKIEKEIRKGNIVIDPYDPANINPNSYNLRLHDEILVYNRWDENDIFDSMYDRTNETVATSGGLQVIPLQSTLRKYNQTPILKSSLMSDYYALDMKKTNKTKTFKIPEEGLVLRPGILYIGRTVERTFTDKYIPMINGRSSGGRLGISIHICAGFGDIGFDGTWTLEITVVEPVRVYAGAEIAQVCYFKPYGKKDILYKGRYQKQMHATASKFEERKKIYRGTRR